MPPEILATPLLREDTEERRCEAENEAKKPQRIDARHACRCLKVGGFGKRLDSLIEKRLHAQWGSTGLDGDERQELDCCLGVVGLEKDKRGNDEGREHGGEQTGLLYVSMTEIS